jgi:hypothetical protein
MADFTLVVGEKRLITADPQNSSNAPRPVTDAAWTIDGSATGSAFASIAPHLGLSTEITGVSPQNSGVLAFTATNEAGQPISGSLTVEIIDGPADHVVFTVGPAGPA